MFYKYALLVQYRKIYFLELKREIAVWERTGASVSSYSRGEGIVKDVLVKQTQKLQNKLKNTVSNTSNFSVEELYATNLTDLEKQVCQYLVRRHL